MRPIYSATNDQFIAELYSLNANPQVKSLILVAAEKGFCSPEEITPVLQSIEKPILGGIYPSLIFESELKNTGAVIFPLSYELKTTAFDLADLSEEKYLAQLNENFDNYLPESNSLLVFIDAYSLNKNDAFEVLYNYFGLHISVAGAACGGEEVQQRPCLLHNSGFLVDKMIVGITPERMGVEVATGWRNISRQMKVTGAEGNVVKTLNWEPAFQAMQKAVTAFTGQPYTIDDYKHARALYSLSLYRMDGEDVVRNIYNVDGDDLYCDDYVNQGEFVSFVDGEINSLCNAVEIAYNKLCQKNATENSIVFTIYYFGRAIYYGENINKEIAVLSKDKPVYGVVSLGEIANTGESLLEIYNKSCVLVLWNQTN